MAHSPHKITPPIGGVILFKSHALRSNEYPRAPGYTLGFTLPQRSLIATRDVEDMLRSNMSVE